MLEKNGFHKYTCKYLPELQNELVFFMCPRLSTTTPNTRISNEQGWALDSCMCSFIMKPRQTISFLFFCPVASNHIHSMVENFTFCGLQYSCPKAERGAKVCALTHSRMEHSTKGSYRFERVLKITNSSRADKV